MNWLVARFYDPVMRGAENAGLRDWRRSLLGELSGSVLEIGAGTGLNLPIYPDDVDVTVTEPDANMRARLQAKHPDVTVVEAGAESLPFPDATFDAAVSTLVLCSVRDLDQSVAEVYRVLKPGGRFAFVEHVASPHPSTLKWQQRAEPAWKRVFGNCHLTRRTAEVIAAAGFDVDPIRGGLPGGLFLVNSTVRGIATKPG